MSMSTPAGRIGEQRLLADGFDNNFGSFRIQNPLLLKELLKTALTSPLSGVKSSRRGCVCTRLLRGRGCRLLFPADVQHKAFRKKHRKIRVKSFLQCTKILGLKLLKLFKHSQCAVVQKAFLGRHPGHLQKVIARWVLQSTPGSQRQSPRRNRFQVKLPQPKKVKFKLSPLYYTASTWNTLIHSRTANKTLPSMRDISNFFLT